MPNEVIIVVRAVNDTKAVFDAVRADAKRLGDTIAVDVNKQTTERLQREAQASAASGGGFARAGDTIGDVIGARVAQRVADRVRVSVDETIRENVRRTTDNDTSRNQPRDSRGRFISGAGSGGVDDNRTTVRDREHVTVDVDVDKQSLLQKLAGVGKSISQKVSGFFGDGLKTGITSVFSGDILSTVIKGGLITLAGAALAPAIGGAITSGVLLALGGGAIAVGIASAIKNSPTITDAFTNLKEKAKGIFDDFGGSFKGPLYDFITQADDLLDDLKPTIDDLGAALGPVADEMGHGIIGFLQNSLPGISRAIKDSTPLLQTLADEMPGIGDAIGKFFDHIRGGAPNANRFFNDLLNVLPMVIVTIGILIEAFTNLYGYVRYAFFTMVNMAATWAVAITSAARIAFGWIPGLGPKLDGAAHKAAEFKQKVNKQLNGINDVDISVRIKTFGLNTAVAVLDVTRQLRAIGAIGRAIGGVVGQAASGGSRNGLTLVGENGPELAEIAPGGRVHSNADTRRMLADGGGGRSMGQIVVNLVLDGRVIARAMADPQRDMVRNEFGGSVQAAYGYGAA